MTAGQKLKMFVLIAVILSAEIIGVLVYGATHSRTLLAPSSPQQITASNEMPQEQPAKTIDEPKEDLGYVLADDKLDNLVLPDAHTPVYDKYTLAERKKQGLTTELPTIAPYKASQKIAYLTFAGGPDKKNTAAALKILQEKNVPATFYVVGRMAQKNPELIKEMFAAKHAIGNHCYEHNYKKLYPNKNNFLADLAKTDEIIHGIIGVRPLIVRAPGGSMGHFTKEYAPLLKQNGYVYHDWNIDTGDATTRRSTAAAQVQTMLTQMRRDIPDDRMLIILMHLGAGKEETVKALPQIIDELRQRGYDFGVVTPMTPKPW